MSFMVQEVRTENQLKNMIDEIKSKNEVDKYKKDKRK